MVRAKMTLNCIRTEDFGTSYQGKKLIFHTQYDQTIPEDQRFQKASPNGTIEMQVDNPAALAQFEPGKSYYVDFSPVPEETKPGT